MSSAKITRIDFTGVRIDAPQKNTMYPEFRLSNGVQAGGFKVEYTPLRMPPPGQNKPPQAEAIIRDDTLCLFCADNDKQTNAVLYLTVPDVVDLTGSVEIEWQMLGHHAPKERHWSNVILHGVGGKITRPDTGVVKRGTRTPFCPHDSGNALVIEILEGVTRCRSHYAGEYTRGRKGLRKPTVWQDTYKFHEFCLMLERIDKRAVALTLLENGRRVLFSILPISENWEQAQLTLGGLVYHSATAAKEISHAQGRQGAEFERYIQSDPFRRLQMWRGIEIRQGEGEAEDVLEIEEPEGE